MIKKTTLKKSDSASAIKSNSKGKKKSPLGLPKHPISAFIFFRQQLHKSMFKERVGLKLTEVSKVAGELWAKSTEEDKQPF